MKKNILILFTCFFILTNCSLGDDTSVDPVVTKNIWHLVAVNGGVAGVSEQFDLDVIVWDFNDSTLKLTIKNNNTDDSIEDGLDSGIYDYSIIDLAEDSYLVIDNNEFGSLNFTQTGLVINQNQLSTGSGTDGFVYTFQVEVVPVE